jgi:hypothetical protein
VQEPSKATHAVIARMISWEALESLAKGVVLVSEHQTQAYYNPWQTISWTEENHNVLRSLLLSGVWSNMVLALQWLDNSRVLPRLTTELLVGYLQLTRAEQLTIRPDIIGIYKRCWAHFEEAFLPVKPEYRYQNFSKSVFLNSGANEWATTMIEWSTLKIAELIVEQTGRNQLALRIFQAKNAQQATLQKLLEEDTLHLSKWTWMRNLPLLEGEWTTAVRRLDLRGCCFETLPSISALETLPNLEEIDLRDNIFLTKTITTATVEAYPYRLLLDAQ